MASEDLPVPVKLSPDEHKALVNAVCGAFDRASLEQLLVHSLNRRLPHLVGDGPLRNVVFDLVEVADREGWVGDLIRAACLELPKSASIRDFLAAHPRFDPRLPAANEHTTPVPASRQRRVRFLALSCIIPIAVVVLVVRLNPQQPPDSQSIHRGQDLNDKAPTNRPGYSNDGPNPFERQTEPKGTILWANGASIRVAFLDGDPSVHEKVIAVVREWERHASVKFEFGPIDGSYVRITMDPLAEGRGIAGYPGTSCRTVPPPRPTMTLAAISRDVSTADFRRAVLYAFGHVLGLLPEWNNPRSTIPWLNSEEYPPWSRDFHGIDKPFDARSVMLPPVSAALTSGGYSTEQPSELSEGDKEFIRKLYPGTLFTGARPVEPK